MIIKPEILRECTKKAREEQTKKAEEYIFQECLAAAERGEYRLVITVVNFATKDEKLAELRSFLGSTSSVVLQRIADKLVKKGYYAKFTDWDLEKENTYRKLYISWEEKDE